jgi:hypothetical protein
MKNSLLAFYDQRVPRIIASLKTNDQLCPKGKPIDNLTLSLVPPLGPNGYNCWH